MQTLARALDWLLFAVLSPLVKSRGFSVWS